eukprot:762402-Pelagomonas_calceolata.AAC.1
MEASLKECAWEALPDLQESDATTMPMSGVATDRAMVWEALHDLQVCLGSASRSAGKYCDDMVVTKMAIGRVTYEKCNMICWAMTWKGMPDLQTLDPRAKRSSACASVVPVPVIVPVLVMPVSGYCMGTERCSFSTGRDCYVMPGHAASLFHMNAFCKKKWTCRSGKLCIHTHSSLKNLEKTAEPMNKVLAPTAGIRDKMGRAAGAEPIKRACIGGNQHGKLDAPAFSLLCPATAPAAMPKFCCWPASQTLDAL